jgi:hypothetical protein
MLTGPTPESTSDGARAVAAALLDGYEDTALALTELCRTTAAADAPGIPSPLLCGVGDMIRDTAAVQLSWARWLLDL